MSFSNFEIEALNAHNEHRANHGVPPLTLDKNLCNYAQQWANTIAARNVMQHRSNNSYGENIYMMTGANPTAAEAVKCWYDEIYQYNFRCQGFNFSTGHFTQVVWKGSKRLGIAKAQNANGSTYIVANYDPPGNYQGQFEQNVFPPK